MYNDYEREEIIDTAMDILDNTDATMEEAMGVAMENQMSKMKAEARKTGDWSKVAKRQGLKDTGKYDAADRAWFNTRQAYMQHTDRNRVRSLNRKYQSYERPSDELPEKQREFDRRAEQFNDYNMKGAYHTLQMSIDADRADRRKDRKGDYSKSVPANNGRGTQYPKASKEAAIMDTALDYMDMYDVSMEEAIDMAYDYLID